MDLVLNNLQMLIWHKTQQINRIKNHFSPVSWVGTIQLLHLCRMLRPPMECPGYDTKQSDGEAKVMLEFWGIWSTPPFPSLRGPLWPRVAAPDRVLSMI